MAQQQHNILVIGSSNTDMVVQVPHLPGAGETILGGVFKQVSGGKGANQAVAAQRLGGQVTFLACVGDDDLGKTVLSAYKQDGINVDSVVVTPEHKSGVALILVNAQGENCIAVASGANNALLKQHVDANKHLIEQADVILMQLETPLETIEHAVNIAHQNQKTIILNPAPAQALSDKLLSKITILTPNESEASLLTGIDVIDQDTAKQAAIILHHKGVKQVIITMGDLGVYYSDADQQQMMESYRVNAIDTTAAGDTFNGALAAALLRKKSLFPAISFAQAAAAMSVTKSGAQPSIPNYESVVEFLNTV